MNSLVNKMSTEFKKLKKTGFFSIFVSSILCKVLVFIGSTILVRILPKTDYGIYAYILNCISMVSLLGDFGASTAALQFLSHNDKDYVKNGAIVSFSLKIIIYSSILCGLLILLSPFYYPFTLNTAKELLPFLFLLPFITFISNLIPIILRANFENKKYAKFQIFSTFASYLFLITFSILFGLYGAVFSQYIYNLAILVFGIFLCKDYLKKYSFDGKLSKNEKRDFLKFSVASQVNSSINGILLIIDTFLIGLLIADSATVASYKIASAIPHALTFLSGCVAVYTMPHFIKHNKDNEWINNNLNKMIKYGSLIYGILFIGVIAFSNIIIKLIYGSNYLDTVPTFIVLMIGLFFSSAYKIPISNTLHCMGKIRINIMVNTVSAIINAMLNVAFIINYGYIGAAITTTLINIAGSIFYIVYIKKLLRK